jgi:hypothetical protein
MLQLEHSHSSHTNMQLQSIAHNDISLSLSSADRDFLLTHGPKYQLVQQAIDELVERKTLTTPIPIKLNTLLEKRLLIKNFDQCVAVYNQWMTDQHSKICGLGDVYSDQDIDQQTETEMNQWHTRPQLTQPV